LSPRIVSYLVSASLLASTAMQAAAETTTAEVQAGADPAAGDVAVIDLAADVMTYDEQTQVVTASGNVVVTRDGYRLTANEVSYARATGKVEARGNVAIVDPDGNQAFGERVELTESLKDGAVDSFLLILQDGGRLAARGGQRSNGISELDRAVYSPCDIVGAGNCPKEPLWQLKARSVRHDPVRQRIYYKGAQLEFLGVPLVALPGLSHPDGPEGHASGLLVPTLRFDRSLGAVVEIPYLLALSNNSDLTIAPTLYTGVNPALALEYRHLTGSGPIRIGGIATYSSELDFPNSDPSVAGVLSRQLRGYFYGNGRLQHDRNWHSAFGIRLASDDTFLRRYDISRDDTLRNFYSLERHGSSSYFFLQGWAFQGLRRTDIKGQTPIVLPLVDYRWHPDLDFLGGDIRLTANSSAVTRRDGMDTQRASAAAQWSATGYSALGHRLTATALLRGDAYHVSDADLEPFAGYRGRNGWKGRLLPVAAIDVEWPFAGPALGGTQTLTPRLQLSASPASVNGGIPNEDSRAFDLDHTNLFELNRFPGYDRWEGGVRVTYGFNWRLDRRRWQIESELGQSYRFSGDNGEFPSGTGFSGDFSDLVGRNTVRIGRRFDLTHSFRLDKSSLKLRRNEIDVTVGGRRTYATLGYVKLNRDIGIEDLQDREEVRAGGRVHFARYWSAIASVIVDLTSRAEDPFTTNDGFELVRHRLGVAYEDDCFAFGVTWRRDYVEDRDFRRGNTFLFNISFKNLGR
jgi:LPS-assembly protein